MAALILKDQKRGSYRFKRSKVWKLSLSTSKSLKVWEISLQTCKSIGALILNVWKYGSYRTGVPQSTPPHGEVENALNQAPEARFCRCFWWWMFSWNSGPAKSRSVGAFVFERSKYGSSCFKRQKVWELSLEITQSVGALALSAQKYGSSRFIRPRVWALPF